MRTSHVCALKQLFFVSSFCLPTKRNDLQVRTCLNFGITPLCGVPHGQEERTCDKFCVVASCGNIVPIARAASRLPVASALAIRKYVSFGMVIQSVLRGTVVSFGKLNRSAVFGKTTILKWSYCEDLVHISLIPAPHLVRC